MAMAEKRIRVSTKSIHASSSICAFQREVNLTTEELEMGRRFLFKLAQPNQDFPMGEIHLMSDCLGISETAVLIEDANNTKQQK